jgi:hypothetical protein
MLYPVLSVFLTQTLGASPTVLGLVEGMLAVMVQARGELASRESSQR